MSLVSAPALRRPLPVALARRIGIGLSLALLLIAFVSLLWTPYPADQRDIAAALAGMGPGHWLGTDALGRDTLSLAMKGMLTSYVVAGVGLAIGVFLGVPLGLAGATLGVVAARLVEGLAGTVLALSLLGVAALLAFHAGPSPLAAMFAIGLFNAAVIARALSRFLAAEQQRDDIAAARLAGLGGWELMRRHVLPDLAGPLVQLGALLLAAGLVLEASLAFLGLGAQPGGMSLGLMLRDARPVMAAQPLLLLVPGGLLLAMNLGLQLIALGSARREATHAA